MHMCIKNDYDDELGQGIAEQLQEWCENPMGGDISPETMILKKPELSLKNKDEQQMHCFKISIWCLYACTDLLYKPIDYQ